MDPKKMEELNTKNGVTGKETPKSSEELHSHVPPKEISKESLEKKIKQFTSNDSKELLNYYENKILKTLGITKEDMKKKQEEILTKALQTHYTQLLENKTLLSKTNSIEDKETLYKNQNELYKLCERICDMIEYNKNI